MIWFVDWGTFYQLRKISLFYLFKSFPWTNTAPYINETKSVFNTQKVLLLTTRKKEAEAPKDSQFVHHFS